MINTNLAHILHRFRDITLEGPYIWLPLWFNHPLPAGGGGGWLNRKVTNGQGTKWRRNIAENLNRLSSVHERYRATTDGLVIACIKSASKRPRRHAAQSAAGRWFVIDLDFDLGLHRLAAVPGTTVILQPSRATKSILKSTSLCP